VYRIGIGRSILRYRSAAALVEGARHSVWAAGQVLFAVKGLILGRISVREIGGPVFIAQVSAEAAREGPESLLLLMAFLSINLAILNLLPIPALDGGHLVFLALEGLRGGRPVPSEWRGRLTMAGVYFLVALMIFVVINDLLR
jgi:regulator of sigma E protease